MSWECRYLRETFCDKRKQQCCPGAPGCVLEGKFVFPLREEEQPGRARPASRAPGQKKSASKRTAPKDSTKK